jgi:hypothetical protein
VLVPPVDTALTLSVIFVKWLNTTGFKLPNCPCELYPDTSNELSDRRINELLMPAAKLFSIGSKWAVSKGVAGVGGIGSGSIVFLLQESAIVLITISHTAI